MNASTVGKSIFFSHFLLHYASAYVRCRKFRKEAEASYPQCVSRRAGSRAEWFVQGKCGCHCRLSVPCVGKLGSISCPLLKAKETAEFLASLWLFGIWQLPCLLSALPLQTPRGGNGIWVSIRILFTIMCYFVWQLCSDNTMAITSLINHEA